MGLDMYLTKKVYVGAQYEHRNVKAVIDITVDGKPLPIDTEKVSVIEEAFGYWRKANAIHSWFVRNVQEDKDDCGTYYVHPKQLQELLDTVNEVLAHPELAVSHLPPQSGLFFGDTKIDDWYMQDLQDTKEILEKALAEIKADDAHSADFYYHASW